MSCEIAPKAVFHSALQMISARHGPEALQMIDRLDIQRIDVLLHDPAGNYFGHPTLSMARDRLNNTWLVIACLIPACGRQLRPSGMSVRYQFLDSAVPRENIARASSRWRQLSVPTPDEDVSFATELLSHVQEGGSAKMVG